MSRYQVKLQDGRLIFSPTDDDECIQIWFPSCIQRADHDEVDQGGKESSPTVNKMQPVQNESLADGSVQTSESTTIVRKSRHNIVMPSWATPAMTAKSAKLPVCGCGCDSEHSVLMKNILVSWQLVCVRRRCPDSPNVSISLLTSMSEAETQDVIDLTDDSESTHDAKLSASELLRAFNESAYCAWRPAEPRNKLVPTARAK